MTVFGDADHVVCPLCAATHDDTPAVAASRLSVQGRIGLRADARSYMLPRLRGWESQQSDARLRRDEVDGFRDEAIKKLNLHTLWRFNREATNTHFQILDLETLTCSGVTNVSCNHYAERR